MNISYYRMAQLQERMEKSPFSSPVVILSENGAKRWGLTSHLTDQEKSGKILWISQVDSHPSQNTVYKTREILRDYQADGIIAVGGGSSIDLAKAVSAFHSMTDLESPELLELAIKRKAYLSNERQALPVIAVPTTAGTGSEVTQWATIWDANGTAKYSIDASWLKPSQAWIVPQLIASMPPRLALSAGLDALCHAAEAYWAKASTPISKALAIRALQIIAGSLKPYLTNMSDEKLCEDLCTGSLLSGLAFSITRTTACHSISYPLTYMFGVKHGFAAAITLAQIAKINHTACNTDEILEIFSPYCGIQPWIDSACASIVDLRLRTFGISKNDIDDIAFNSFGADRMDNNPTDLTIEMVKEILLNVY